MKARIGAAVLVACMAVSVMGAPASAARTFANCTALQRVYPHGVGRPNAVDHTSGRRVTNFKKSRPLYRANRSMDRDGDGIACEKR